MARYTWVTADKGIRYREHETRKHGIKFDRYYTLRYYLDGKRLEEALGWGVDGWTLERARAELVKLKEAHRLGQEIATLRGSREQASDYRKVKEQAVAQQALDEITFSAFWDKFYLPEMINTKSTKSIKTEQGLYKNWVKSIIGDIPLKNISVSHMTTIVQNALHANKSPRTIEYILAVISQLWNLACLHDLVDGKNPIRLVKKPKKDNRRMRFLTKDEARTLLHHLAQKSTDTHDVAVLALFGGLRIGEIHSLQWADISFDNKLISIRDPKNKKNRHCHMNQEIYNVLTNRHNGQSKSSLIFVTSDGKQRIYLSKTFERVVSELGFNINIEDTRQKIVFHSLRHTFASWLVQKGVPLYTVAGLMGHSTLESSQRYSHLAPDNMKAAALSLSGELELNIKSP